ncbi:MAG: Imm5 family immunity protein [Chloroflexota bacterium]|nr:Imm5 family immunity protein [Chloroflexota bacterium]
MQVTVERATREMLPLAAHLQQAIEQAYAAMVRRDDHAVIPIYRQRIYAAFGPARDQLSYQCRGWLDVLTARFVLPMWQEVWPGDPLATRLFVLAEDVLHGRKQRTAVADELGQVWAQLEGSHAEAEWQAHDRACNARQAAVQTLAWLVDPWPSCRLMTEDETDWDLLDPICSDAAMWAVNAYAGAVYDWVSDPTQRREFWTWWLHDAIPVARRYALKGTSTDGYPC